MKVDRTEEKQNTREDCSTRLCSRCNAKWHKQTEWSGGKWNARETVRNTTRCVLKRYNLELSASGAALCVVARQEQWYQFDWCASPTPWKRTVHCIANPMAMASASFRATFSRATGYRPTFNINDVKEKLIRASRYYRGASSSCHLTNQSKMAPVWSFRYLGG